MDNSARELLDQLEREVNNFIPKSRYPHDEYVIITLYEAIAAAREGNFGVGAVLVREDGEIIQRGHNHVFSPYFRSDLHAEMYIMTRFEEQFADIENMRGFTLFSSLEPCPMCFTRLIISGVEKVYYAASDSAGGMVQRFQYMPTEWKEMAARQEFALARCSPKLTDIALKIFLSTLNENDRKLQSR